MRKTMTILLMIMVVAVQVFGTTASAADEDKKEPIYLMLHGGNIIKSQEKMLLALNAEDGKLAWKATLADKLVAEPTANGDKVFAPINNKRTSVIDLKTGKILESYLWPSLLSTPITFGKTNAFFGLADGTFYCMSLDFKKTIWKKTLAKDEYEIGKAVFGKEDKIYLLSNKNNILSVDSKTGNLLWKASAGAKPMPELSFANDLLFVGSDSKILRAYNAKDGKKAWEFASKGDFECGVTLGAGNKLYVGNTDKNLYCLDQKTGKKLFEHTTQGEVKTTPALCSGRAFFASSNGRFYCIDASTGVKIITAPSKLDCNPITSSKYVYYIFKGVLVCAKPDLRFVWNHMP